MKTGEISIQEALGHGLAAHRAGRAAEAERIYKAILQSAPRCFDALHLLGVLKASSGQSEEADRLLKKALMVEPRSPDALNSRANVLQMMGRKEEALACCTRALQVKPEFPEALNNRGNILHDLKRYDEALASLDQALALRPTYAKALNNRGIVLRDLKRPEEALACFDRALTLEPNSAEAHNNRARALHALNRLEEALAAVDRALKLSPDYAKALHGRGMILKDLKRPEEALQSLDRALAVNPGAAEPMEGLAIVLNDLGRYQDALACIDGALKINGDTGEALSTRAHILINLRRFEEALKACDRALELEPDLASAHNNRGVALWGLEQPDQALASFGAALTLDPGDANATLNHGVVLADMKQYDESLNWADRALSIRPDWADGWLQRGNLLMDQRRYADAISSFDRALAVEPEHPVVHEHQSMCRLAIGDMARGWEQFEWRFRALPMTLRWQAPEIVVPRLDTPAWLGNEDPAGKTLLLYAEQGLGDTIQFSRYAALAKQRGARIILEVQPELKTLMRTLKDIDVLIAQGEPTPDFDLRCPLMSLPLAFRTTVETIPGGGPYLTAEPERVAMWRERTRQLHGRKIGIVWSGNPRQHDVFANRSNQRRSTLLSQFAPLGEVAGASWISLQKGDASSQAAAPPAGMTLIDWTSELRDFADTAALVQNLDLVITVDTSVGHLAGALGKPVWVLTKFNACWRWLLDREDTPWYPTMRIFRQSSPGNWESIMQQVKAELPRWIGEHNAIAGAASPAPPIGSTDHVESVNAGIAAAGV